MATSTIDASFITIQDPFLEYLNEIIESYTKVPITCALTVTGHDYWVILEYGSAPAEPGPRQPTAGDDVIVSIPNEIPHPKPITIHQVEVNGQNISSSWYPIAARHKKTLHFIDRQGRERFDKIVFHPGVKARGFIRNAIRAWEFRVMKDWERMDKEFGDDLPERKDIVRLINFHLRKLLEEVRNATPIGDDDNPEGHLRDAWGIVPAR